MASLSLLPAGWSRRHRRVLAVLLVVLSLALAGCSVLGGSNDLPSGETAAERFTSLDGYSGTVEVSYSGNAEGQNRTLDVKIQPTSGKSRVEFLSPSPKAGNLYVYNGSHAVIYNASKNEYRRISMTGVNRTQQATERLRRFVNRARSGAETKASKAGVSPLPVVPSGSSPAPADSGANRLKYEYRGTETVLGRTAYVIHVSPVNDSDQTGIINQTIWIDSQWFVTLKAHSVMQFDDEPVTYSMRFHNITFDQTFPDGTFSFDPPPGATVNESRSVDRSVYDSREALNEASEMSVPDPSLPDGFELDRARLVVGDEIRTVSLLYRRDTTQLFVSKDNRTDHKSVPNGERVTIGSRRGNYVEYGSSARVTWTCEGSRYAVGGEVSKDVLIAVAESMVCD